ncbi:hypothetical protein BpHYR1_043064 [Brachionus plicatilis]|uniref:Uncharacterized protein n=1 Tax=Brachionus plicatilis TaxID=10195 RepID=A0A3M7RF66_BRAPC|nr:hypothetical protein BpHYR1_043064 [Brachionus plicatilis]
MLSNMMKIPMNLKLSTGRKFRPSKEFLSHVTNRLSTSKMIRLLLKLRSMPPTRANRTAKLLSMYK